jgi:hypothetical protein
VDADIHRDLAPIAGLLGTWRGEGKGEYPSIESFGYGEEVHFWHVGKPVLGYQQRTWSEEGRPLHGEMGFWRMTPEGLVELVLAHPLGVTEVAEGTVSGGRIEVASTAIGSAPTAKEITRIERHLELEGDTLRYEVRMAAVGLPLSLHLAAELKRSLP